MNINRSYFHYAVVQFMPFSETREFANIGIVLIHPSTGRFSFKIAPQSFKRVIQFFDDLDEIVYKRSIKLIQDELEDIRYFIIDNKIKNKPLEEFFLRFTDVKESVVHYSEISRIAAASAEEALAMLYQRFVGRDFLKKEYREQQMAKALKSRLDKEITAKFGVKEFVVDIFKINMPLVHEHQSNRCIIKPLAFHQRSTIQAKEHGESWLNRMNILIENEIIEREQALFTIEKPASDSADLLKVHDLIVNKVDKLGINYLDFEDEEPIVAFAKRHVSNTFDLH